MDKRIGRMQFGHQHCEGANRAQIGHRQCEELARWRRDVRRVAERRARRAWGECPKGKWLDAALELMGMLVVIALFGGLLWLYLMATPDQASAEAEMGRMQFGHQHCEGANPAQSGHQHCEGAAR